LLSELLEAIGQQIRVGPQDTEPIPEDDDNPPAEPDDLAAMSEWHASENAAFRASLSPDESQVLESYQAATEACEAADKAARAMQRSQYLESDLTCRWILRRVMELGWTPERFAAFDRDVNRGDTRAAQKPERIGKKYQWLAYHELAARVLDHRPLHHDSMTGTRRYEGPWQMHLRDIDPSFLLKREAPSEIDRRCWWIPVDDPLPQGDPLTDREWLVHNTSIPDFTPLLSLQRPADRSLWYPLEMSGRWREPEEAEERSGRNYRRHLTFSLAAR
jgi:hypothetical protein